jgi:hypothetical protein
LVAWEGKTEGISSAIHYSVNAKVNGCARSSANSRRQPQGARGVELLQKEGFGQWAEHYGAHGRFMLAKLDFQRPG